MWEENELGAPKLQLQPDVAVSGVGQSANVDSDDKVLEHIADKIKVGRCVLFLGSGVHRPPGHEHKPRYTYNPIECPPVGPELAKSLAAGSGFKQEFVDPSESEGNLMRVSQHYECKHDRHTLIAEIRKLCHVGRQPSAIVRALASLNFPLVVTTNYDRLYENALEKADKKLYTRSFYQAERRKIADCEPQLLNDEVQLDSANPFILKVHGDIENPPSIVVTDEDYVHFVARMSDKDPNNPVPKNVRTLLIRWPTLFIGYSFRDYNLRLLFHTIRAKLDKSVIPPSYSIDLQPDPLIFQVYGQQLRYFKFIKQDMWTMVPRLYRKVTGKDMPP